MKALFIGVDVSKGYADFVVLDGGKNRIEKSFKLNDTTKNRNKLIKHIKELYATYHPEEICVGFENTGGYEMHWYRALLKSRLEYLKVARINPQWIKNSSLASGRRNKTDKISARDIAEYMIAYPEKVAYNQEDPFYDLRRIYRDVRRVEEELVAEKNFFHALIYDIMPLFVEYTRNKIPHWVLLLISKYPSYESILRAGIRQLVKIPYVSEERAKEIIDRIQKEKDYTTPSNSRLIQKKALRLMWLQKEFNMMKDLLEQECRKQPELWKNIMLLTSFKAIGRYSAIGLMLYIRDIHRFSSIKKIASYFGVHPVYKQSGDKQGGYRMSKKGHKEVRKILYMIVRSAIKNNPHIQNYYNRLIARGKHPMSAKGICMHKILRIIYGMLKHQSPYNPDIDKKNQQKYKKADSKKNILVNITEEDLIGPLSRKQYKLRRELLASQTGSLPNMNGIAEKLPSHKS